MAANRVLFISYLTCENRSFLTVGRQADNKVYCGPRVSSLRRLCLVVNQRVDYGKMSIYLWSDGWTACSLDRSV